MTRGSLSLTTDLVTDWKERAACAGYPNGLFFPGPDSNFASVEKARAICRSCPVANECLEYAFQANQRSGMWGGTTEDERKSLRRKWLAARRRSA
ncbi:MAG: WhiB family transcriptional regulator [Actinomycetota bacterium]|nr:WhiB family transcriptional regulator [Actinomycetota bacterium]